VVRAPTEKPRLHIFVLNVVARSHLAIRLADFRAFSPDRQRRTGRHRRLGNLKGPGIDLAESFSLLLIPIPVGELLPQRGLLKFAYAGARYFGHENEGIRNLPLRERLSQEFA
jgi:hypothetical protein